MSVKLVFLLVIHPATANAEIRGSAGIQSKYIWGGVLMDAGPVLQGSLEYIDATGLLLGTWFSTVDTGASGNNQVDVYAGYSGSSGRLDYETGIVRHSFTGDGPTDNDADVNRAYFSGSLGPARLVLKSPLNDASWTSAGDVYASAGWVQALPARLRLSGRAGFYYFADDAVFDNDSVAIPKQQSFAFRDATFSLVHEMIHAPVELGVHLTIGGERRDGSRLDDHVWFSITADLP
ncbi:MAG: TorF family putative porin [Gammaproteobacteria bacterium]|nr:TorF family putative porin [Gammaproteobacteria bacterium]